MKNKFNGYTYFLIIAIIILVVFAFITIYKLSISSKNARNNTTIYNEPPKTDNTKPNENLNLKKEYKKISSYKTNIYDTDENRIYNIKLACEKLNEYIIDPGEEFSFNSVMGSMGEEDGFKKALGFDSNGNDIKVFGGGICQISSTLYNAVLLADLEVTERHAHSKRVYYVPKNKDATVFSGGPDLKFVNNTNNNLMICAKTDGYTVTVTLKSEDIVKK